MNRERIRNFVIIAHIDHGKSTLADRFLELTGTVEKRKMHEQYLDMHPLERERGITIKMQPVRMIWRPNHTKILNSKYEILNKSKTQNPKFQTDLGFSISDLEFANSKQEFVLNLIDTPGHADFGYEVSRALAAVEGAILLVDATQGVQAQTVANLHLAEREGLVVVPAINKIDLPSADVERAEKEIRTLLGALDVEIFKVSAKEGTGVAALLRGVIARVPPPSAHEFKDDKFKSLNSLKIQTFKDSPLQALIFDSKFDAYQGVIAHVRIFGGSVKKGDTIAFAARGNVCEALEVGVFTPARTHTDVLAAGEIGYIATGIKETELVRVGDTIVARSDEFKYLNIETFKQRFALPGYREVTPMVFASVFPENQDEYETLRDALGKLKLEDAAMTFEPEDSAALGRGFRAGFLGMLHMEIIAERLQREYALALLFTNPSVAFRVRNRAGADMTVYSAAKMPSAHEITAIEEPWARLEILTPPHLMGPLTALVHAHAGTMGETVTISSERMLLVVEAPLREIIVDFYDELKSASRGFASMSYEIIGWRPADVTRMDILVAGEKVPSFAEMVPREQAYHIGRERCAKLKELLPRQMFVVAIQAEVDGCIVARESVAAMSKDVTKHMYGGDRTRKMKLWKKQQRGKERLKESGKVDIPPEVFLKMLKR